jgi:hypothetical protein
LRAALQPPGRRPARARPSDDKIITKEAPLKLSFSEAKGKPKFEFLTIFVQKVLPTYQHDGDMQKAFYKATGWAGDHLAKALVWNAEPHAHVMPMTGDIVAYAGESKLIISQADAEKYEDAWKSGGGDGPRIVPTRRGKWALLEMEIVRGLVLWGCDMAKPQPPRGEWEKRSQDFADEVF